VRAPPSAVEVMETRASYTLVGTFVLILMLGMAGFVIWLAKFSSDVRYDDYQIFFSGSVTGLSTDATVRYRGIPVGHVTSIEIAPDDIDKVRVTIQVDSTTPVRTDTVASIEMQGITGVAYIQLIGASESAPPLKAAKGEDMPTITASSSALESVVKSAPELISAAIELMNRGSALMSDDNRAAISATLASVSEIVGEFALHKDAIGAMIEDARTTLDNVRTTSDEISKVTTGLEDDVQGLITETSQTLATLRTTLENADRTITTAEPDIKATLADLKDAAASIRQAAASAQQILVANQEPLDDFAQYGLYEITQFVIDARALVSSLTQIAIQLERDPASFLLGGNQQGYQAQ